MGRLIKANLDNDTFIQSLNMDQVGEVFKKYAEQWCENDFAQTYENIFLDINYNVNKDELNDNIPIDDIENAFIEDLLNNKLDTIYNDICNCSSLDEYTLNENISQSQIDDIVNNLLDKPQIQDIYDNVLNQKLESFDNSDIIDRNY